MESIKLTLFETVRKGELKTWKVLEEIVAMKYKEGATNETLLPFPQAYHDFCRQRYDRTSNYPGLKPASLLLTGLP